MPDDLFSNHRAHARRSDPSTSHDAARSMNRLLSHAESEVYAAIRARGTRGATWDELHELTGMDKATISPRFKPLRKAGCIKPLLDDGGNEMKRPGNSGRGQTVWIGL